MSYLEAYVATLTDAIRRLDSATYQSLIAPTVLEQQCRVQIAPDRASAASSNLVNGDAPATATEAATESNGDRTRRSVPSSTGSASTLSGSNRDTASPAVLGLPASVVALVTAAVSHTLSVTATATAPLLTAAPPPPPPAAATVVPAVPRGGLRASASLDGARMTPSAVAHLAVAAEAALAVGPRPALVPGAAWRAQDLHRDQGAAGVAAEEAAARMRKHGETERARRGVLTGLGAAVPNAHPSAQPVLSVFNTVSADINSDALTPFAGGTARGLQGRSAHCAFASVFSLSCALVGRCFRT